MREVVLTNKQGEAIGTAEIIEAHTGEGKLHSAISVYVFRNDRTEILIQQRAAKKTLFAFFWANTCCSHPFPDEDIVEAGERRLQEECGFTVPLRLEGSIVYQAKDPGGELSENEHDSLLTADIAGDIAVDPDPEEIAQLVWRNTSDVLKDMEDNAQIYAPWFILGLKKLIDVTRYKLHAS